MIEGNGAKESSQGREFSRITGTLEVLFKIGIERCTDDVTVAIDVSFTMPQSTAKREQWRVASSTKGYGLSILDRKSVVNKKLGVNTELRGTLAFTGTTGVKSYHLDVDGSLISGT